MLDRITLARTLVYPTPEALWTRAFLWPILSTVGYLLIYPLISRPLLVYWDKQQTKLADLRNAAQKKTLLTKEESQRIILDGLTQQKNFEETLSRQARENEALKTAQLDGPLGKLKNAEERIQVLERELERERANASPQNPLGHLARGGIEKGVRSVLSLLAKSDQQVLSKFDLAKKLNETPIRTVVYMESAVAAQMAQWTDPNQSHVRLTERGRDFVVKEGLDVGRLAEIAGPNS